MRRVLSAGLALLLLQAACGPKDDDQNNNTQQDAYVFPDAAPRPDAAPCADRCQQGEKQCVTGGYQECGNFDSDECLEWGPVVACAPDEKCVDGECQRGVCVDECTDGSVKCNVAGDATQDCELNTTTGCWEWGAEVACPTNETCSGGVCSSTCTDECVLGSRQCASNGYQECANHDSDSCMDWGPVIACSAGETCSNGYCDSTCTNECTAGTVQCAGPTGYQTCGDFDADPCMEWGAVVPCLPTESCSNGLCEDPLNCQDECSTLGETQCTPSGQAYQTCGDTDPDACWEWGPAVSCNLAIGETCVNGQCTLDCDCDYYSGICEPDVPNSTTPCACDPACGTPCVSDGHCDSWCPVGVDPDCSCPCDFNEYCEADAPGSSATCLCDPDCEPNEWACDDDGHCDTWCPTSGLDVDPDCGVDPCRTRWMTVGYRYADELWLTGSYEDPDSVLLAPWVLLSPDLSSGEGEVWVEFAAENVACVDQILIDTWGYDDSVFGDGAEVYLYNWDTFSWDLLPYNFDLVEGAVVNTVLLADPYLLCGTGLGAKCYINGKIGASAWDNTHFYDVWIWVHMTP